MRVIDLYHRLPHRGRSWAATLRGSYLRRYRYGKETSSLIADALARDSWSAEDWERWRSPTLSQLLKRAVERVPFYRDYWRKRPGDGWQDLANWPILSKQTVAKAPRRFVADDCNPRRMFKVHTSGSTGTPLTLWRSRQTTRRWYALCEARQQTWWQLTRDDRSAMLGGQLVVAARRSKPPFWVWNSSMRQLYLSSYHIDADSVASYVDAIKRYRARYLLGYPSALAAIARLGLELGLESPPLELCIANAEPVFDWQRQVIELFFSAPLSETYGSAELVAAASQCPEGTLHLWPEVGYLEIIADDRDEPVPPGETGRLVCTGLLNTDMPLIRYEIGDRGVLPANIVPCACGRRLPALAKIEGRLDDEIVTPEGRHVGRLDPIFKAELRIREAQIVQTSPAAVELRVVPAAGYGDQDRATLLSGLRQRLGETMELSIIEVERLPRNAAGKLRAVVSALDRDTILALQTKE